MTHRRGLRRKQEHKRGYGGGGESHRRANLPCFAQSNAEEPQVSSKHYAPYMGMTKMSSPSKAPMSDPSGARAPPLPSGALACHQRGGLAAA